MKLTLTLSTLILVFSQLNAQVSLPHSSDFEAQEGFTDEAPLSGDWEAIGTAAVITDDAAYSGTQSVRITSANPGNIISLRFDPAGNNILFADYYMQLTASALPSLPSITAPETTAILAVQPYLTDSGEWVFLDGDGSGSGVWCTAGATMLLDGSDRTGWHRVTLRFNLTSNLWDAYIDGNLLAVDLGFVEALLAGSEAINIYGNSSGVAYMDMFSLTASNPLFTDADLDGIDDAFEALHGLDSSIDDRGLDPDADGLSNVEEYAYGTNPVLPDADEGALSEILFNRSNWYVDSVSGDNVTGVGSEAYPFQSLDVVLT
jgi:hypothetical protein